MWHIVDLHIFMSVFMSVYDSHILLNTLSIWLKVETQGLPARAWKSVGVIIRVSYFIDKAN